MKQVPVRLHAETLGDLLSLREARAVGGLEAWCQWGSCERGGVMLDLDALVRDLGPDYDWKRLRAVCTECDNRNTSISLRWTLSDMTYSHHGSTTPGSSMIGHNGAPREPVKILKKRRRKLSEFPLRKATKNPGPK